MSGGTRIRVCQPQVDTRFIVQIYGLTMRENATSNLLNLAKPLNKLNLVGIHTDGKCINKNRAMSMLVHTTQATMEFHMAIEKQKAERLNIPPLIQKVNLRICLKLELFFF